MDKSTNTGIAIGNIEAVIFDFDGVLTDNLVYVDQNGVETVCCSRSDGLAFDILRQTKAKVFILSTEKNPVVQQRGKKLGISVYQGLSNKEASLTELAKKEGFDLAKTLYVGNDLNDYAAMKLCRYSACPGDSHPKIRELAKWPLKRNGGNGAVRELVEEVLGLSYLH